MLWGKDKIQAALERLDRLTKDEGLSVAAQTMGMVHGLAENMRVVMGGAPSFHSFSRIFVKALVLLDGTAAADGTRQNLGMCYCAQLVSPLLT